MTEAAAATTFTMPGDPMERLVETVGRPKLGGVAGDLVAYKLTDPFTGEDADPDGEGELCAGRDRHRGLLPQAAGHQAGDASGRLAALRRSRPRRRRGRRPP